MASPTRNQGEGDTAADRRYREKTESFVNSDRGQGEIRKAGNVSPKEEKEIRNAEERAKARAKEHDPEEKTDFRKPS